MKSGLVVLCIALLAVLQSPLLFANGVQEIRDNADTYYQQQNFKKAYREYYKLAKIGDRYSQNKVSQMYENGEGKSADLYEAYAWAALAAENGAPDMVDHSNGLLQRIEKKDKARDKAEKLKKKYGSEALARKLEARAQREAEKKSAVCVGSRMNCG